MVSETIPTMKFIVINFCILNITPWLYFNIKKIFEKKVHEIVTAFYNQQWSDVFFLRY